jgi:site-specific recombinase XerD
MLGYSWSPNSERATSGAPMVRAPRAPKVVSKQPPAFPEDKFEALLCKGFLHSQRKDFRGACITLLLHGAGFRESEPFHLYVQDVFPDPADRLAYRVHIHHPEFGEAPSDVGLGQATGSQLNRATFLRLHYGLEPRNRVAGSLHAGWKNPLLDEKYYMRAIWFMPQYGRWFKELWDEYLRQIVGISRTHPWAFVNLDREPIGAPYTIDKFQRAHAAACERIGLQAAKALGTTPHGHRHAFGQRLKQAGLDPAYIKLFMHHKSVNSQQSYTRPTPEQTRQALAAGLSVLSSTNGVLSSSLLLPDDNPQLPLDQRCPPTQQAMGKGT